MEELFNIDSIEQFKSSSEEILSNLYIMKHQTVFPYLKTNFMYKAKEEVKKLLLDNKFDITLVTEKLRSKDWDEEKLNCFFSILNRKKTELLYSCLLHYNSANGEVLINVDWIVKLVLGSCELNTLTYPLLQLVLTTVSSAGDQKRKMYEFNKDMLLKMINCLEDYKKERQNTLL